MSFHPPSTYQAAGVAAPSCAQPTMSQTLGSVLVTCIANARNTFLSARDISRSHGGALRLSSTADRLGSVELAAVVYPPKCEGAQQLRARGCPIQHCQLCDGVKELLILRGIWLCGPVASTHP